MQYTLTPRVTLAVRPGNTTLDVSGVKEEQLPTLREILELARSALAQYSSALKVGGMIDYERSESGDDYDMSFEVLGQDTFSFEGQAFDGSGFVSLADDVVVS